MLGSPLNGAAVAALWAGDTSAAQGDDSAADLALCSHLVYWCNGDLERVDRLFRRSGLMRDKWDDPRGPGQTYGSVTLRTASENRVSGGARPAHGGTAPGRPTPTIAATSGEALMAKDLPDPVYVVEDTIPQGVTLLVGSPKLGKSWLALDLALTVAAGGAVLGRFAVTQGDVLFLALEDSERRLKKRILKLLGNAPMPGGFSYATKAPMLSAGLSVALVAWLKAHPVARLIVVDTLGAVGWGNAKPGQNAYAADYEAIRPLKRVADDYGVAILGLHHDNKTQHLDPFKTVSGSQGLTGAVDTALLLTRVRGEDTGLLQQTGRDVDERKLALTWTPHQGRWSLSPEGLAALLAGERRRIIDELRGAGGWCRLTKLLGLLDVKADDRRQRNRVTKLLARMKADGLVGYRDRGMYRAL